MNKTPIILFSWSSGIIYILLAQFNNYSKRLPVSGGGNVLEKKGER